MPPPRPQPTLARAMRLHTRAQLTVQGNILIAALISLVLTSIFCAVVFFLICKNKRKRAKGQRRLAEERTPFVEAQGNAFRGGQNSYPLQGVGHEDGGGGVQQLQHAHNGPAELQGDVSPEVGLVQVNQGLAPAQQLDGYAVMPKIDNSRPVELPSSYSGGTK